MIKNKKAALKREIKPKAKFEFVTSDGSVVAIENMTNRTVKLAITELPEKSKEGEVLNGKTFNRNNS